VTGAGSRGSLPAADGRFVLMSIDELTLLVPQRHVHALEPAFDVRRSAGEEVARITVADATWPVYCLSMDLRPLSDVPGGRHVCVLMESGSGLFGLLCDRAALVEGGGLEIRPLPACMRTPHTPLRALALQGDQVCCISSAKALIDFVGEPDSGAVPHRRVS